VKLEQTSLEGAWIATPEKTVDERGWFARTFDARSFRDQGLELEVVQANASFNAKEGTLRGLHFQRSPHAEAKLISCVRGTVWDVAVDIRPGSPTYCSWHAVELSDENGLAFFIPGGMAHGFQTLTDNCELHYLMGHEYVADAGDGVRWDDLAFGIQWPEPPAGGRTISGRDLCFPDFQP